MQTLIFFDTETTGRDPATARMIQLAYSIPGVGEYCQEFAAPCPIEIGAMATHHITPLRLEGKPEFGTVEREPLLRAIAMEGIFVAHNAPYDVQVLKNEGVEIPTFIDTLKVARQLLDVESYSLQWLRYYLAEKNNPRLYEAMGDAHDALADVRVLEAVFGELAAEFERQGRGNLEQFTDWALKVTHLPGKLWRWPNFGKNANKLFAEIDGGYLEWALSQNFDADIVQAIHAELEARKTTT